MGASLKEAPGVGSVVGLKWSNGVLIDPIEQEGHLVKSDMTEHRFTLTLHAAKNLPQEVREKAAKILIGLVDTDAKTHASNATMAKILLGQSRGVLRFPTSRRYHTLIRLPRWADTSHISLMLELVGFNNETVAVGLLPTNEGLGKFAAEFKEGGSVVVTLGAVSEQCDRLIVPRLPQGVSVANKRLEFVCALREVIAKAANEANNQDERISAPEALGASVILADADTKDCLLDGVRHQFEAMKGKGSRAAAAELAKRVWLGELVEGLTPALKSSLKKGQARHALCNTYADHQPFDVGSDAGWSPADFALPLASVPSAQ